MFMFPLERQYYRYTNKAHAISEHFHFALCRRARSRLAIDVFSWIGTACVSLSFSAALLLLFEAVFFGTWRDRFLLSTVLSNSTFSLSGNGDSTSTRFDGGESGWELVCDGLVVGNGDGTRGDTVADNVEGDMAVAVATVAVVNGVVSADDLLSVWILFLLVFSVFNRFEAWRSLCSASMLSASFRFLLRGVRISINLRLKLDLLVFGCLLTGVWGLSFSAGKGEGIRSVWSLASWDFTRSNSVRVVSTSLRAAARSATC